MRLFCGRTRACIQSNSSRKEMNFSHASQHAQTSKQLEHLQRELVEVCNDVSHAYHDVSVLSEENEMEQTRQAEIRQQALEAEQVEKRKLEEERRGLEEHVEARRLELASIVRDLSTERSCLEHEHTRLLEGRQAREREEANMMQQEKDKEELAKACRELAQEAAGLERQVEQLRRSRECEEQARHQSEIQQVASASRRAASLSQLVLARSRNCWIWRRKSIAWKSQSVARGRR